MRVVLTVGVCKLVVVEVSFQPAHPPPSRNYLHNYSVTALAVLILDQTILTCKVGEALMFAWWSVAWWIFGPWYEQPRIFGRVDLLGFVTLVVHSTLFSGDVPWRGVFSVLRSVGLNPAVNLLWSAVTINRTNFW